MSDRENQLRTLLNDLLAKNADLFTVGELGDVLRLAAGTSLTSEDNLRAAQAIHDSVRKRERERRYDRMGADL